MSFKTWSPRWRTGIIWVKYVFNNTRHRVKEMQQRESMANQEWKHTKEVPFCEGSDSERVRIRLGVSLRRNSRSRGKVKTYLGIFSGRSIKNKVWDMPSKIIYSHFLMNKKQSVWVFKSLTASYPQLCH